jgi:hypothetical protein
MAMQRQINIVIKTIGADTAKKQIQDIIPENFTGKVKLHSKELQEASKATHQATRATNSFKKEIRSMTGNILASLGAVALLTRGMSGISNIFDTGGGFERVKEQFTNIVGDVKSALPGLREATRGTVEDLTLLQTANRAVIEGMNSSKLRDVFRMGTVASRKLGLDTADTLKTITSAITRQDESAMTTLGSILKLNPQLAIQLKLISQTAGAMSPVVAIQYRQAKIMELLNKQFGNHNALLEDTKEVGDAAKASFANFAKTAGEGLAKALVPLTKALTTTVNVATNFIDKFVLGNKSMERFISFATTATVVAVGLTAAFKALSIVGMLMKGVFAGPWFLAMLKFGAILAGAGIIAGMLTLTNTAESLADKLKMVGTGFRYLFDLIMNYDNKTGMAKVLAEDEAALGNMVGPLKAIARTFIQLKTIATEFFEGFIEGMSRALGTGNSFVQVMASIFGTSDMTTDKIQGIGQAAAVIGIKFGETAANIVRAITSIERFISYLKTAAIIAGSVAAAVAAIFVGGPALLGLAAGGLTGAGLGAGVGLSSIGGLAGIAGIGAVTGAGMSGFMDHSPEERSEPTNALMPQNAMMNAEDTSALDQRKTTKLLEEILNQNQKQTLFEEEKKTDREVRKATQTN